MLALCVALRSHIVGTLLRHGRFSGTDADAVATTFAILAVVWAIYAFAQVLVYAFFALQDTPAFLGIVLVGIAANIALDLVLLRPLGVTGLAIATAASAAASNAASWVLLARKVGGLDGRGNAAFFARAIPAATLAALAAAGTAAVVGDLLGTSSVAGQATALAAAGTSGGGVYLAAGRLLGIAEVNALLGAVGSRLPVRVRDAA